MASGLARLPPHLAHSILLATVDSNEQNKLTIDNVRVANSFAGLAMVSKHWRALTLDVASNVALATLIVSVGGSQRKDLLELRRQLTLQRGYLLSLHIQHVPRAGQIRADQWAAVLSCVPKLEEIDLQSLTHASHAQLGAIVRAAGQQCANLEALVVSAPHRNNQNVLLLTEEIRRELSDAMYDAIEHVYEKTNHVGLRRLCVCMRFDLQGLESTRTYMDKVLRFCPNLERFDGYRAAVYAIYERTSHEQWFMDIDLWTRFCATLTKLVEFQWICVPFATRFFEIFGEYPKPQMESMVFTTAMNWGWNKFMRDVGPRLQQELSETGFAGTAKNAHTALRACPNLTELQVYWYSQQLPPIHQQPQPVPALPGLTMMNPEIFGDAFWEAAARSCPYLTTVSMVAVDETKLYATVRSFTDRSLRAIATLPWLQFFEAQSVNVTGDGIFDLTVNHVSTSRRDRRFHLIFGDLENEANDFSFYEAITRFVEKLLAAEAPLPCISRDVSLGLANKRNTPVDRVWSETYLANLKSLLDQVHNKHPAVCLNVFANECDGRGFSQISEFAFDTNEELTRLWIEHDDIALSRSLWNRNAGDDEDYDDDDDLYEHDDDDSDQYYDSNSDLSDAGSYHFGDGGIWGSDDDDQDMDEEMW